MAWLQLRPQFSRATSAHASRAWVAWLILLSLAAPGTSSAVVIRDDLYVTDGPVYAIAVDRGTIYIGGNFTQVGPRSGGARVTRNHLAALDAETGAVTGWNPDANGVVYALSVGPLVYVGGQFTVIGGQVRHFLAALDPATGDATGWDPNPDGSVNALAQSDHGLLVGGDFTRIGFPPVDHPYFAILDPSSGSVIPSPVADNSVLAIVVDGGASFVGGDFTRFGGKLRNRIAAMEGTGSLTTWDPGANGPVRALAVADGTVYAGGDFTTIGGEPRDYLAALNAVTGIASDWDPGGPTGPARAVVVRRGVVFAGGAQAIVALDLVTVDPLWELNLSGGVNALAESEPWVYAGGSFTTIGGAPSTYVAGISEANIQPYGVTISDARVLEGTGGTVTAGFDVQVSPTPLEELKVDYATKDGSATEGDGDFRSTSGTVAFEPGETSQRVLVTVNGDASVEGNETFFVNLFGPTTHVAIVDGQGVATIVDDDTQADCGALYSTDGTVYTAVALGGTIYVGGLFSQVGPHGSAPGGIGWQPRANIAALDAATGVVTGWKPDANGVVRSLLASGATVYAGGEFTAIGGATRNRLAALDAVTGVATAWDPNADGPVRALAVSGGNVYAGGRFSNIGGQARNHLAALDVLTGLATGWDPNVASAAPLSVPPVQAVAVSGNTVYVAGKFLGVAGQFRSNVAALDAATGKTTAWNPSLSSIWTVRALVPSVERVYLGGDLPTTSGIVGAVMAVDATTGQPVWSASANSTVRALALSATTVCVGGDHRGGPQGAVSLLDAATGAAAAWDPVVNDTVYALAVTGNIVYAGGAFDDVGGSPHSGIACMDLDFAYALTTTASPDDAGTVGRNPNLATYLPGSSVTLTAMPAVGYAFTGWSGDAFGSANPLTVIMGRSKNITAHFVGFTVDVAIAPNASGTVIKNPDQATYAPGTTMSLTARPSGGFQFANWSGDASGSANPLSVVVDGDKSVTANFTAPATCGSWNVVASATRPSPRVGASAVWDPVRHRALVFGGFDGGQFLNDLWQLDERDGWTRLVPSGTLPNPRDAAGLLYDAARDRMLLVGGNSSDPPGDVWELALSGSPRWSPLVPTGTTPAGRFAFTAIYDPGRDRVVLFGGYPLNSEAWALSLAGTPAWTQLFPAGQAPAARYAHVAIYDPVRDRMLVQGGSDLSTVFSDTWALSLVEPVAWAPLATAGAAPQRFNAAAAYDPARDRMVLAAGSSLTSGQPDEDVWSLSLEFQPIWSAIAAGGVALGARRFHSMLYDPDQDALLSLFGTDGASVLFDDTKRLACSGGWWLQAGGAHGTVTATPSKTCYANNEVVTLQATSGEAGYGFLQWLGDASGSSANIEVTMNDDKTVVARFGTNVGVDDEPLVFSLEARGPNPNRGALELVYSLPEMARVRLEVFDLAGRQVARLVDGVRPAGRHHASWHARERGSGVYFVRYETPARTWVRRVALLR